VIRKSYQTTPTVQVRQFFLKHFCPCFRLYLPHVAVAPLLPPSNWRYETYMPRHPSGTIGSPIEDLFSAKIIVEWTAMRGMIGVKCFQCRLFRRANRAIHLSTHLPHVPSRNADKYRVCSTFVLLTRIRFVSTIEERKQRVLAHPLLSNSKSKVTFDEKLF
jgi:hypothetical protein